MMCVLPTNDLDQFRKISVDIKIDVEAKITLNKASTHFSNKTKHYEWIYAHGNQTLCAL